MHETTPRVGDVSVSYPNFLDWRSQSQSFSAMAAVCDLDANLGGVSQPETVSIEAVSTNFLSMLGVRPMLGRDFDSTEESAGTTPVALLGYGLWQTHFAADANVLGRTITIDGRPVQIVGVLPADFRSTDRVDLLEPIGVWKTGNESIKNRGDRGDMVVIGRLARGVTVDRAKVEMDGIAARLAQAYPDTNHQFGAKLQPIRDLLVGDVRSALLVLFGAVIGVLLIACANVANLCLIRGTGRTREIALRTALGAGRGRIVAQLLTEGAVLAALGGVLGVALALGGVRGLASLIPMDLLGNVPVTVNGAVLAFAALIAVASTLAFGLAPAIHLARTDVQHELKDGGRTGSGGRTQQRWRAALAVAEMALALVLLVGAGLMMRSLSRLMAVDSGIQSDRVLTAHLGLRTERYNKAEAQRQFWQQALDDVRRLPGVQVAALGSGVPMTNSHSRTDISIEGLTFPTGALPHPDVHVVTPGYATALGIRLLSGRLFADTDAEHSLPVGLINRTVAERFFAGADPVGKRFAFGRVQPGQTTGWITIVGVLDDTRMYGLDNPSRLRSICRSSSRCGGR